MTYKTEEERENAKKESRRIYYEKNRTKIIAKMKIFNEEYSKNPENKKKLDESKKKILC